MPIFDTAKRKTEPSSNAPTPVASPPKQRYKRIVRWLKANYGDRFEGASTDEIEKQLTMIFKEVVEPNFINEPKYAKGFKAYIEQKQYGDLVSVDHG
ncbi:MAG: hypothetical protein LLG04_05485 [Parachlamydia sp.]|nr:hypothetical protein [Parachlamydia sp.]